MADQTDNQIKIMQLRNYQAMPLGAKIRRTEHLIREWYEAHDGLVYLARSFGKDSDALADIIYRMYPDIPHVFANTGNELDSVIEHMQEELYKGYPIVVVKPKMTFWEIVNKYGWPVISKRMSDYIGRVRRTTSDTVRRRHLLGQKKDGSPSPKSKISNKWQYLINAEFKTTNKCCGILKNNPTSEFRKDTGRKAFVAVMATESEQRLNSYLNYGGCNAFDQLDPTSRPIMFWTEQDVLRYILDYNVTIASAYGEIKENCKGELYCTEEQRTGCKFCMFGVHLTKGENRIQRLARVEPHSYYEFGRRGGFEIMKTIGVDYKPFQKMYQQDMFDERYNIDAREL